MKYDHSVRQFVAGSGLKIPVRTAELIFLIFPRVPITYLLHIPFEADRITLLRCKVDFVSNVMRMKDDPEPVSKNRFVLSKPVIFYLRVRGRLDVDLSLGKLVY